MMQEIARVFKDDLRGIGTPVKAWLWLKVFGEFLGFAVMLVLGMATIYIWLWLADDLRKMGG